MNDEQLLRYSRHILLDAIGIEGQSRLLSAGVLVVGAGGLGSPVILFLSSAGVGRLVLVDPDRVDLTNLQRQVVHRQAAVGRPKVVSAAERVAELNDGVIVHALPERADDAFLDRWVPQVDLVVDCSDNFATRHAINAACVRHGRPLVSGAALGFDGQVSVYDSARGGPCYACVFPPDAAVEEAACATMGVFAPLVGIVGSVQAAEALKCLAGIGEPLAGRLLMLDGLSMEWDTLHLPRDPGCPVCGPAGARRPCSAATAVGGAR